MENRVSRLSIRNIKFLENGPYSMELAPGECCGLNGASGVGKSQFLRAIADVIAHGGECMLEGVSSLEFTPQKWRSAVALIPAESFWWFDDVEPHFAAVSLGDSYLSDLLSRLGFGPDVMNWQISRLSTGERQRLSLVRTLIRQPQVLLLDEPTSGLDQKMAGVVEEIVTELCIQKTCSCLWVSHDQEQLKRIATRCFTLERTEIVEMML